MESTAQEATPDRAKVERIEIAFRHCTDGTVDCFAKIDGRRKACAIAKASELEAAQAALLALYAQDVAG